MSDKRQDDGDTLSALMAAAQTKYNEASAEARKIVDAAQQSFNQGMQKADQMADAARAKFNEGMDAARQLANDTKAKFEAGVKAAGDMAADAKVKLEKGIADAKTQVQNASLSNLGEKTIALEACKQAVQAGAQAMGYGSSALSGLPGSQDVAKAWQNFQDAGGMPVAKMVGEQKLEDLGIRKTDATVNKMVDQSNAEQSKFLPDNDMNRLNKAVEQDAKLGKGPDDTKQPGAPKTADDSKFVNPKGPQDSKFVGDDLKAKYLSRAQDLKQDTNQAATRWDSSNPKPPQSQPTADKPAVNANPSPSSQAAPTASAPKPPSPSPSPKP